MGFEVKSGFLGIVTNTADLQAPPGALKRAQNVVIRRAGVCEQRPGTVDSGTFSSAGAISRVLSLIPYQANTLAVCDSGASTEDWWDVDNNAQVSYTFPLGSSFVPRVFRKDLIGSATIRGNLYVGWSGGVVKWQGSGAFKTAGVPLLFAISGTQTNAGTASFPAWLPTASQVGYRIVGVKKDANGLISRSIPSGATYVENTSGADRYVVLSLSMDATAEEFDEVEIYRTRTFSTSVTPDEEYQLIGVEQIAATASFVDIVTESARGATLYTSPSREGIEGSNYTPPAAGCLAAFKSSLFFGNVITPARVKLSFNVDRTTALTTSTGIGFRTTTATITSGSNTITVASATGLQVGQVITADTSYFNAGTTITGVSGTTITMSANALSSGGGVSIQFQDAITIDGEAYSVVSLLTERSINRATYTSSVFDAYYITPPEGGYDATLVIEARDKRETLSISASHGDEYQEPVALTSTGTPDDHAPETYKHWLMWSKTDEPEHVPIINFAAVGDKNSAILALEPTRDALFIFKEDGIYRLTGVNGQWSIDPFDLTTRCILPCSVRSLNNRIFLMSNKGLVAVSDAGVEIVSLPIHEQLKGMVYELTRQREAGTGYYVQDDTDDLGICASVNERDSEYMLAVGTMMSGEASGITGVLVYNDITRAFTSWTFKEGTQNSTTNVNCLAWHPQDGTVLIGQHTVPTTIRALAGPDAQDALASAPLASDGSWSATISSIVGSSSPYTAVFAAAHNLTAGDVISTLAGMFTVLGVTSTIEATFAENPGTGSSVNYRPITCLVEPRSFIQPNMTQKEWTQFVGEFAELWGSPNGTAGMRSSIVVAGAFEEQPLDLSLNSEGVTNYRRGASIRSLVPNNAKRGWKFDGYVEWVMLYGHSALEAIYVEYVENQPNRRNLAVKSS